MTCNYRVVKIGNYYGLYEVFYNSKGQPCGMTNDLSFGGSDPHDLIKGLETALKDAKTRPVFICPKDEEWGEWDDNRE